MRVLGLETSCDETGLAIVDSERGLIAQVLHSQIKLHREYGGVVPELSSRDHIRRLVPLLNELLMQADMTKEQIDAVAYTRGPGLMGALMTGALFGRSLALGLGVPAVGVHHLEGHLLTPLMPVNGVTPSVTTPFVALLVSGGHTQLIAVRTLGEYELLGESIDDAAGECFDKCAKMIGLPYPGGPEVAKLASFGDPSSYELPDPLNDGSLNFSFSGLKSAVRRLVDADQALVSDLSDAVSVKSHPSDQGLPEPFNQKQANLCASLEARIVGSLVKKSLAALELVGMHSLVIAGGVSANRTLRATLEEQLSKVGKTVHYADPALCTDNGAMIAFAGLKRLEAGFTDDLSVTTTPRWPLSDLRSLTN